MASLRVTQNILVDRVLGNLNRQSLRILDLQTQLATGRRVNAPSDAPLDARRAIRAQSVIARNEQFLSNMSGVGPRLRESSTTIESVVENLRRARELTLQGGSGTNGALQREAIALEIDSLLEDLAQSANHQSDNVYIFSGTRTLTRPFEETRNAAGEIVSVAYNGNSEDVLANVAEGVNVAVNLPGDAVFLADVNVFEILVNIRNDLRSGDLDNLNGPRLEELSRAQDQLLSALAELGSVENRLERIAQDTEDFNFRQQERLSDAVDADFADVIVSLNAQTNAFQAALNAGARVIQPSLLDFVR